MGLNNVKSTGDLRRASVLPLYNQDHKITLNIKESIEEDNQS